MIPIHSIGFYFAYYQAIRKTKSWINRREEHHNFILSVQHQPFKYLETHGRTFIGLWLALSNGSPFLYNVVTSDHFKLFGNDDVLIALLTIYVIGLQILCAGKGTPYCSVTATVMPLFQVWNAVGSFRRDQEQLGQSREADIGESRYRPPLP